MTNQKSPKKRPKRSQEDIMANAFLRATFKPVKKTIMMAWFLDVASVLVLVGQVCVLVAIFGQWLSLFLPELPRPQGEFGWYVVALFVCMLVRSVMGYAREAMLSKAGMSVVQGVRGRLFEKMAQLGLARRDFGSDGALASKMVDEPDHLAGYARFEVQKMTAVSTPFILAVCVGFYSIASMVILLITAPLVPIFMAIIGIATARKSREQMDALAQLSGRFLDWIRGADTLERLGATDVATQDIAQSGEAYRKRTMDVLKVAFLNSAVLELIASLAIASVAVYLGLGLLGKLPWSEGKILTTYEVALFVLLLVPEFYAPLRRLGAEYHVKGQAISCAKAIAPLLNFKPKQHGHLPPTFKDAPTFELTNVTAFGDDGRVRLSPVSLTFLGGKRTALVGQSGMGKSTILQILLGFGDYEGNILVKDGQTAMSYDELDLSVFRKQMGYLSQNLCLLPMTIAQNLRLAKPSASDDELKDVLQKVGLWQVVNALADGINTKLGERGQGLSGGQAGRIAIAQLLLQDSKVWLLDEPTEHLDKDTASHIRQLLFELSGDKTVIWVTHDEQLSDFDKVCRLSATQGENA